MSLDAMKQALTALERGETQLRYEAITALRAAIEQAERPWQGLTDEEIHSGFAHVEYETFNDFSKDPEGWCIANARYLETILKEKNSASSQRKPLSDGWILGMWPDTGFPHLVLKFARAIEAAHNIKEKNT